MLKFVFKTSHHVMSSVKASTTHLLYFHRNHPFSTSIKNSSDLHLYTVTYLINTCGFSPEKALSASKYVEFETPHKPDSVLAFFKNHGFTQTQISSAIRMHPPVLLCNPQKTLLPKLEFLKSKGLSSTEVARITSMSKFILTRSLENKIIPSFDFFDSLLQSEERTQTVVRCHSGFPLFLNQSSVILNIVTLRKAGVPNANMMPFLMNQPRIFMVSEKRFRECVEEVEKMGFNPTLKLFMFAIHTLRAMTKSTWEKKVEVYKKWGWTQDEILAAFKKHPGCMTASEDKISKVMDFVVNKMGWESSLVASRPVIISMSLEKRIVPRCAVYQALLSKGVIKTSDITLSTLLDLPETRFLKKVLSYHEEEAGEVLKLYKERLDLASN